MSKTAIKISVIGAGFVGSTAAYTLALKGIASDIVLVDANPEKAIGEAMDIEHGSPFVAESIVNAGGYEETRGSDMVIITAGTSQKPDETRIDLIARNAAIMRDVATQVAAQSPEAVILIISNPADIMSYVFREVTGFPKHRVIGSGTNLDSARLRYLLSQKFGISSHDVHAQVWGEHGDSEFPVWSLVQIAGMGINEASDQFGGVMSDEDYGYLGDVVRNAAYEVINRKGATYYGIGASIARICEAVLRDEKSILPVSVFLHGQYGIDDVYLSLPAILGEHGVEKILTPVISDDELDKLHHSAAVLKEARAQL
ncbi:L-lactate dehydrogenase [Candidatus Saccharibacteria bacterium]|nr:L-lactate dehydrogenase [Candidatus Saccharibacteria bacterium]